MNTLTISMEDDSESLDPRVVRTLNAATVTRLFYEGLTSTGPMGKIQNDLAKDIDVSEDGRTYTITLKEGYWSDGSRVAASDFANTWKSLLAPAFPSPNAYQFFSIKGARSAKEGKTSLDEVGIEAKDDNTLIIELEEPTPYFPKLLATHYFFPVKFTEGENPQPLYNGPYLPSMWKKQHELIADKNPKYRNAKDVQLDRIHLMIIEDKNTSLQMYEMGSLDWAGSPLSTIPTDAISHLKEKRHLKHTPGAATYWFRFNTIQYPLNNLNIRKALTLALNREDLIEHVIPGYQQPATQLTPRSFGLKNQGIIEDDNVPLAWEHFQNGLKELNITIEEFPHLKLCYQANERSNKIAQAVQQQWKKGLGIDVQLEACEKQFYYSNLSSLNYQISLGGWFADFHDPISFLQVFSSANNGSNNTGWENPKYKELIELSAKEQDEDKRLELLSQAEKIILEEVPVAPLYHPSLNFMHRKNLKNVEISELGYLDFKDSYLRDTDD